MSFFRTVGIAIVFLATTTVGLAAEKNEIKVGITSGSAQDVFKIVRQVALRNGLDIKIVNFNDYQLPNAALAAGDIDANAFQHKPFLDNQIKARGYALSSAGLTVSAPLAFYSKKYKSLDQLPDGARVGIQNDPSNGNRALQLLASKGFIGLTAASMAGNSATPRDVTSNRKNLKLVELDAAQLPRSLDDLDIAALNDDFAQQIGLNATRDGLAVEDARGPYANLIAVRTQDLDKPWVKQLVAAYQSPEVREYIQKTFQGSLLPAF
jgi:D-methionine transport system substrate-binding protein